MTRASGEYLDQPGSDLSPGFSSGLGGFRKESASNRDVLRSERMARIIHGVHDMILPVAGKTVADVRTHLMCLLNFGNDIPAFIQGDRVDEGYVVTPAEVLEFLTPVGHKGVGRIWSREQFCESFRLSSDQFQEWKHRGLPIHAFSDGEERITETDFDLWSASNLGLQSPWLTTEQAAAYLHTSVKGIYGKVERGELSKGRGGLFSKSNLDDYAGGVKPKRRSR